MSQTQKTTDLPSEKRLEQLFRHVLQTAPGRHLLALIKQYRQEATK